MQLRNTTPPLNLANPVALPQPPVQVAFGADAATRMAIQSAESLPQVLNASKFVKKLDFHRLLTTPRGQSHFIYVAMILSRIAAAAQRGRKIDNYREVYEHALRDMVGFTMFFFGSSFLIRLFTRTLFPKAWKQFMTAPDAARVNRPFMGKTIAGKNDMVARVVRGSRKMYHSLVKSDLLSKTQIEELSAKRLAQLKSSGLVSRQKLKALATEFSRMVTKRNAMSMLGLVVNIALLGFGIPLLNIIVTKDQVKHQKHQGQDLFPQIRAGLNGQISPYASSAWPDANSPRQAAPGFTSSGSYSVFNTYSSGPSTPAHQWA